MSELITCIGPRSVWPSTLANIYDVVLSEMQREHSSLCEEECRKITQTVVLGLSNYFGGRDFYIPRGERLLKALRNNEIFQLSGKLSQQELAIKFKLSKRQISEIISQQHELRRKNLRNQE